MVECGCSSTHSQAALCYLEARIGVVVLVAVNVDDRVFELGCAYYMRRHTKIKRIKNRNKIKIKINKMKQSVAVPVVVPRSVRAKRARWRDFVGVS